MNIENNGLDTIVYVKSLWHNNFKDRSNSFYALELMIMFYYDVMKYLSGTKGLFFNDKIDSVQAVGEKNDYISIAKKIEYIDEDEYIEIINRYGEIELVPIFDYNNKLNWKIIEDYKEKDLTKQIEKIINKIK